MAKGLGLRLHREVLDCYFNATSITAPTNIYVSLHTADPGDDGQTAGEVSGNGYARKLHNDWTAAAETGAGTSIAFVENGSVITFATASGGNWGTITHAGLWTSLAGTTEADYLGRAELTTPRAIDDGDTASFASGALDIQVTQTA
jgi:hypothetical protein